MDIEKSRQFIYRNARPIDLARWQYFFENGSKKQVLNTLAAYQNEDGGFGHGLEPDCWNPNSSPMQTWAATEIIREVELNDAEHPIIQGILKYLALTDDFDGNIWRGTIPSNNEYPHAPWWGYEALQELSYNPTACLAGFVLKYAAPQSQLYARAISLAQKAYAFFKEKYPLDSMHTASCFVDLYEYMQECGADTGINAEELKELLQKQIKYILTSDTSLWSTEYVCKPSLFIHSCQSDFYSENKDICAFECEFIARTQKYDGTWNITWQWDNYPRQWAISKNWWKSDLIIKNLRFYNAMHKFSL